MPFKRSIMRYAHVNGHTTCRYNEDGDNIITCGIDGDIRVWKSVDDDDPTSKCIGEFALSLVQYDKRLLVSTDCNCIQGYTYPAMDKDGIDLRFSAPATCIRVDKKVVAAGSEDTEIKVAELGKPDTFYTLNGHTGPILSIDLSPMGLLTSSAGDGTLKVWNLKDKTVVKTIDGFETVKEFESVSSFVSPVFEPTNGTYLAYAKNQEIILLKADDWSVKAALKNPKITADYSICAFSPCGKYIAAGSITGEISIWIVETENVISGEISGESQRITSICWNPRIYNELAYCDSAGQLGTIINISESGGSSKNRIDYSPFEDNEAVEEDADEYIGNDRMDADSADEDNENCISLNKIINETMGHDEDSKDTVASVVAEVPSMPAIREYKQQAAFQPSSTPSHLEHRYLLWNDVGIVRAHNTDNEEGIDVEFHDASVHHGIHLNNYLHHTMGSLSKSVLALTGNDSSKLVCIALSTGGIREWSVEFPNFEEAVAVTTTERLVAVATEARYLRIFSPMGTQRGLLSVPGPVVALAGHQNRLAVFYHESPANKDQHIAMMLIEVLGLRFKCRHVRVPLSPGSELVWCGFTDEGSPVTFDKVGLMRVYLPKSNTWHPICDTTTQINHASEAYYIISVSEEHQTINCVQCRGSSFPVTTPRPLVMELKWQQPFCELNDEVSQVEERLQRDANFKKENNERDVRTHSLKLFAMHCQTEQEAKAKELIEIVSTPAVLAFAVKYASQIGRQHLADKLSEMLPQVEKVDKERQERAAENDCDVVESSQQSFETSIFKNSKLAKPSTPVIAPKKMVLGKSKRNPFKSSANGGAGTPPSALSHLTSKAIGFDRPSTPSNDSENSENCPRQGNDSATPVFQKPKFDDWYKSEKNALQDENPDMSESELVTLGMSVYKQFYKTSKRKLDEESESGVSKLGRFQFNS